MAHPHADRGYVDEAQEALRGLVVSGGDAAGVFQLVEAPLDEAAKTIQGPVVAYALLSRLTHWNDGQHIAFVHGFSASVEQSLWVTAFLWAVYGPVVRDGGRICIHDYLYGHPYDW